MLPSVEWADCHRVKCRWDGRVKVNDRLVVYDDANALHTPRIVTVTAINSPGWFANKPSRFITFGKDWVCLYDHEQVQIATA